MALSEPTQPAPTHRLLVLGQHSHLGNGFRDWNEASVLYIRKWDRRELAELGVIQARRFGEVDNQLEAAYTRPFGPQLTASTQLSFSPTHHVLPRHSVGAGLQFEFAPAWLAHARLRRTSYQETRVVQATLMLERYVGDFSASLAWRPVSALGTHANGYEARGNYHYGDDSYVGVIAAAGREATQIGPAKIELADVRSVALVGRHRIDRLWSVLYGLDRTRQGTFYTRKSVSAGVQHDF